jgi:hypothetical protein
MPVIVRDAQTRINEKAQQTAPRGIVARTCVFNGFMNEKFQAADPWATYNRQRDETLQGLRERFYPLLSDHSRQVLEQKLQGSDRPVTAQAPNQGQVFRPFKIEASLYPNFNDVNTRVSAPLPSDPTLALLQAAQRVSNIPTCNVQEYLATDHYMIGKEIHSSKYSAVFGDNDILAHELGHWISHQLRQDGISRESRERYDNFRRCLQSFYPRTFWQRVGLSGGRTEEDFADWFAATISTSKFTFACDLNGFMGTAVGFLTGQAPAAENLYTPERGSVHSNHLFRDLHRALVRGENLPRSCEQLMELDPSVRPRRCEY